MSPMNNHDSIEELSEYLVHKIHEYFGTFVSLNDNAKNSCLIEHHIIDAQSHTVIFFTNKTGGPHGDMVGLINMLSSSSYNYFLTLITI